MPAVDCRLLEHAEGYLSLELPEQAVRELSLAGQEARQSFAWNLLMGESLRACGRWDEAVSFLQKAHDMRPEALAVLLSLGWCFKRADRIDRAIDSLREAEQICRKTDMKALPLVHYNLGCYFAVAGRKRDALEHLSWAIERDSSYLDMVNAETDLATLRADREFQELVARLGVRTSKLSRAKSGSVQAS